MSSEAERPACSPVRGRASLELDRALARRRIDGAPGGLAVRPLAKGAGWSVDDVICTSGPEDRSYEEVHQDVRIALVVAGTFQCRSSTGAGLLAPGALLLGNDGQCFECGHDHARGDRCVSFGYAPERFERLAADAGIRGQGGFRQLRVPPVRALAPIVAQASKGVLAREPADAAWEELSLELAVRTLRLTGNVASSPTSPSRAATARVTEIVRAIDEHPDETRTLREMADDAHLSPYHFLRAFSRVTGVTPHQYLLRARLREAALRLLTEPARVVDVALDSGFGDVSNFNHAFRAEFGTSPRAYRRGAGVSP